MCVFVCEMGGGGGGGHRWLWPEAVEVLQLNTHTGFGVGGGCTVYTHTVYKTSTVREENRRQRVTCRMSAI